MMRMNPGPGRCAWLLLLAMAYGSVASAQGYRPIVDHIHLAAPDPPAAVKWYQKYFGGQTMAEGTDRFLLGDVRVIFSKRESALPSQGSAVDHIGFSVANLDEAMKAFQADGVKIVTPARDVPGLFPLAFIEDPWGTRIEVVQDSAKLGVHHLHLRGADPAAMLAWYSAQFGGRVAKLKDRIDGIDLSGVWLLVQRGDAVPISGPLDRSHRLPPSRCRCGGCGAEDAERQNHHRAAAAVVPEWRHRAPGIRRSARRRAHRARAAARVMACTLHRKDAAFL